MSTLCNFSQIYADKDIFAYRPDRQYWNPYFPAKGKIAVLRAGSPIKDSKWEVKIQSLNIGFFAHLLRLLISAMSDYKSGKSPNSSLKNDPSLRERLEKYLTKIAKILFRIICLMQKPPDISYIPVFVKALSKILFTSQGEDEDNSQNKKGLLIELLLCLPIRGVNHEKGRFGNYRKRFEYQC